LQIAIPKPNKPLGDPKTYRPISLLCVTFKILERLSHLWSWQTNHQSSPSIGTGGLSTQEVNHRSGDLADARHRRLFSR